MIRCNFVWTLNTQDWHRCTERLGHDRYHRSALAYVLVGGEDSVRHRWLGPDEI